MIQDETAVMLHKSAATTLDLLHELTQFREQILKIIPEDHPLWKQWMRVLSAMAKDREANKDLVLALLGVMISEEVSQDPASG